MASLADQALVQLKKGTRVRAEVIELQAENGLLVSYRGNLFLVRNESGFQFKVGEKLALFVVGLNPLEFKIFQHQPGFERFV